MEHQNINTMTLEQYEKAVLKVNEVVNNYDTALKVVNEMVEIFNLVPAENPDDLMEELFGCLIKSLFE